MVVVAEKNGQVQSAYANDAFDGCNGETNIVNNKVGPEIDVKEAKEPSSDSDPPVSFVSLFRFCNVTDVSLILLGLVSSACCGLCFPLFVIIFGDVSDGLINGDYDVSFIEQLRCNAPNISSPQAFKYNAIQNVC